MKELTFSLDFEEGWFISFRLDLKCERLFPMLKRVVDDHFLFAMTDLVNPSSLDDVRGILRELMPTYFEMLMASDYDVERFSELLLEVQDLPSTGLPTIDGSDGLYLVPWSDDMGGPMPEDFECVEEEDENPLIYNFFEH